MLARRVEQRNDVWRAIGEPNSELVARQNFRKKVLVKADSPYPLKLPCNLNEARSFYERPASDLQSKSSEVRPISKKWADRYLYMLSILQKMKLTIHQKVKHGQGGLYAALVFPIAFAFILTFAGSRIFSYLAPDFYFFEIEPGLRIHHFAYGFFVLAASGYLALLFNGPRAKYLISLFHGFGLGLAFDEFGMWLRLKDDDPTRWNYDGFLIILSFFFLILSAKPGIKMLRLLWPFKKS